MIAAVCASDEIVLSNSQKALFEVKSLPLFLVFLLVSFLSVQAQTGSVSGTVADSTEVLAGASVAISGTTIGITTDLNGNFLLSNIPVGKRTLLVTFLGYQKYTREITIEAGKTLNLGKLMILVEAKGVKEVTVESQMKKGSENQAINMTKNSQRVITVISSENIKKLPDKNAADALKRVAGVAIQNNKGEGGYVSMRGTPNDWTSTLINGDRLPVADEENTSRSFEFEVLPSDLIDRIDVTRTVTPDLEGDNVGGSINFILKEPVDKRTLMVNAAVGYDGLAKKPMGNLNILWGDVSKNKKFKYVLNATVRERYYAADAIKFIYGNNFNHAINRYELKDYSGNRTNFGANGGFEAVVTPKFKLGMKAMTGIMYDNKYQNKVAYTYASGDGATVQPQFVHGLLNRQLFGGEISAEIKPNDRWKINVKYAAHYNRFFYGTPAQKSDDPRDGYFTVVFNNTAYSRFTDVVSILQDGSRDPHPGMTTGSNPSWSDSKLLDIDNPYHTATNDTGDHYTNIRPKYLQPINDSSMSFLRAFSETNYTYEMDPAVAQIDVKYKINDKVSIQFGVKERYKKGARSLSYHWWTQNFNNGLNTRDYFLYQFQTEDPRWGNFLSEYGSRYAGLNLHNLTRDQLNSFISTMESPSYGNVRMINHYMDSINEEYPYWVGSSYDYTEVQSAGYAMVDATVGRVNIVGGIRLEHTLLHEHAKDLDLNSPPDTITNPETGALQSYQHGFDAYTNLNYLAVLPNININYQINYRMNLRFAASRTFHRQNFQETKPGAALIKYSDFLYIKGNPKLKPSYSYNFDVSYQFFWGNKGLFTISSYAKYIVDHIFVTSKGTNSPSDPLTGFVTKTYNNASDSWVWGIEGEIKRRFDFLPGFASGFGIGANITYSISRMKVPGRPGSQAMAEQSPLLYNVSLLYEKYGVRAALALNYNSPFLLELNLTTLTNSSTGELLHKDQDYDTFMGEQYSLDFQLSYEFKKHFSVYLEANNLLNSVYKEYLGRPDRPLRVEYYKQRGQIGFKYEL